MSKLRFSGETEPWTEKKLGELIESGGSGGTPLSSVKDYYGGDYPFLSISDITKQGKYVTETKSSLTQAGVDNSGAWVVPTGSLIYAMYASVGKLCINNYPLTTSQALYAMKLKEEANIDYIYSALERVNVEQLNRVITQGTQKNINAKTLKNFNIPLPSLSEQSKIGGFLSALDEQLGIQAELVELLALEYTGYSQQIFSQKLRFKDENGQDYPEWEQKKLGEVANLYQPPTISVSNLKKGKFPVYGATGIIGYHNEYNHEYEQVVISCRGSGCGISNFTQVKSWINGNAMVLNTDDKNNIIDKKFLYHKISNTNFNSSITGTGQPQITRENVTNLIIPFPSLPEQVRIGGFLSALSARLEKERELLTQLREQKKAYLQKLLP